MSATPISFRLTHRVSVLTHDDLNHPLPRWTFVVVRGALARQLKATGRSGTSSPGRGTIDGTPLADKQHGRSGPRGDVGGDGGCWFSSSLCFSHVLVIRTASGEKTAALSLFRAHAFQASGEYGCFSCALTCRRRLSPAPALPLEYDEVSRGGLCQDEPHVAVRATLGR